MNDTLLLQIPDESQMEALGAALAGAVATVNGARIYLHGELGTGKTTLVRGYLHAAGHQGPVRSPTYTLIEPYPLAAGEVLHLDLYRLADAEELEYLGLRDLEQPGATLLVEWPQRGGGLLPPPDLDLELEYADDRRRLRARTRTAKGEALLQQWALPKSCPVLD